MNYFYIAKKSSYFCGWLNVIGTCSWFWLFLIIFFYHYFILIDPQGKTNYKTLTNAIPNPQTSPANNVEWTNNYASAFIAKYGYAVFFSKTIFASGLTYWHLVLPLFVVAVFSYVVKTVVGIFILISSIKAKSVLYIYASLSDLFIPLFGGFTSIEVYHSGKKMIGLKTVSPISEIKFRLKTFGSLLLNDRLSKSL